MGVAQSWPEIISKLPYRRHLRHCQRRGVSRADSERAVDLQPRWDTTEHRNHAYQHDEPRSARDLDRATQHTDTAQSQHTVTAQSQHTVTAQSQHTVTSQTQHTVANPRDLDRATRRCGAGAGGTGSRRSKVGQIDVEVIDVGSRPRERR